MEKTREIYRKLVQGTSYMYEVSKEIEEGIEELLDEGLRRNVRECEQYRDKLYSAAAIAEEAGFVKGFRFAVELMVESLSRGGDTNAKS